MPTPLRVDVWSDLVCPWCYIGLHRLRRTAQEEGVDLDLVHHAYQLEPGRTASVPTREALGLRYGDGNVEGMFLHAERAAAAEGLRLELADTIACSTFDGHRLVAVAARHGVQDAVLRRLMRAHFEEHLDLGDAAVLLRLAEDAGLPRAEAEAALAGDAGAEEVDADLQGARQMGVRGVPFFVVADRLAFSGAQPDAVFREAFRRATAPPAPGA